MNYEQASTHVATLTKHAQVKTLDVNIGNVCIRPSGNNSFTISVDGRDLEYVQGFRLSGDVKDRGVYKLSVDFIAGA